MTPIVVWGVLTAIAAASVWIGIYRDSGYLFGAALAAFICCASQLYLSVGIP